MRRRKRGRRRRRRRNVWWVYRFGYQWELERGGTFQNGWIIGLIGLGKTAQ